MSEPYLVEFATYRTQQWEGFVEELCGLIVTGYDFDEFVDAARVKWGLLEEEIPVARMDAYVELDKGWGRAAA